MSKKVVHVIGNGVMATLFDHNSKGLRLLCNLPPFPVANAYAHCIVDFKMMNAMMEGSITVPGKWILGYRPKKWMEKYPGFQMQKMQQIREYYTKLPSYASNYTDFNCGHFAVYYACEKLQADEIHMYGFDSIFDPDLRSCTDFYLSSVRDDPNTHKLNGNWRPIWYYMFKDFKDKQFFLYHKHSNIKLEHDDNVNIIVKNPSEMKKRA
mgnify:CR=1 FL=1